MPSLVRPVQSSPSDMNTRTTEVIIGVDVGTTAVKVAAFGVNGAQRELARALREYRLEQPQAGLAGAGSDEGAVRHRQRHC